MRPITKAEIRDLNLEIEGRLAALTPLEDLVVVKSFKGRRCYGIGFSDPKKDLILRNLVRLMGGVYRPRPPSATTTAVTLYDTTNTARTVNVCSDSVPFPLGLAGSELGFGNPAAPPTPARDDYELASLVAVITPSATTTDETNWRVIVSGSYVWLNGGTVREAGQYGYWRDMSAYRRFLIYHDAVSDVPVPAGGTVSVTYTTQL